MSAVNSDDSGRRPLSSPPLCMWRSTPLTPAPPTSTQNADFPCTQVFNSAHPVTCVEEHHISRNFLWIYSNFVWTNFEESCSFWSFLFYTSDLQVSLRGCVNAAWCLFVYRLHLKIWFLWPVNIVNFKIGNQAVSWIKCLTTLFFTATSFGQLVDYRFLRTFYSIKRCSCLGMPMDLSVSVWNS